MPKPERPSGRMSFWPVVVLAVLFAAAPPLVLAATHVYKGALLWPGVVGNLTGSLIAFILALEFERRRSAQQAWAHERTAAVQREEEVKRRLRAVLAELEANETRVKEDVLLALARQEPVIRPLQSGAWQASHERLAQLVGNAQLIADIANAYGTVDDLAWHLRFRSEAAATAGLWQQVTNSSYDRAHELEAVFPDLQARLRAEVDAPPSHSRIP